MVTHGRFPFGNAVIIETPLDALPDAFWQAINFPTPAPTLAPRSALTCPPGPAPDLPDASKRSLYVLYAHLQAPASVSPGETLACGQVFGAVGMSGNALNPHLHFEAKAGPSGLRIDSMAHYDASATQGEMRNYCLWSVSGLFQRIDPLMLLQSHP
jgi:murein DD-endopeptidase MepM/ murein hydrolase activator NlpD